jgi:hypothetical protein
MSPAGWELGGGEECGWEDGKGDQGTYAQEGEQGRVCVPGVFAGMITHMNYILAEAIWKGAGRATRVVLHIRPADLKNKEGITELDCNSLWDSGSFYYDEKKDCLYING